MCPFLIEKLIKIIFKRCGKRNKSGFIEICIPVVILYSCTLMVSHYILNIDEFASKRESPKMLEKNQDSFFYIIT